MKEGKKRAEEFIRGSTVCKHCDETIPNKDSDHWICQDVEAPERATCINNLTRRPQLMCWYCKGKIVTEYFAEELRPKSGNRVQSLCSCPYNSHYVDCHIRVIQDHFSNVHAPSSCVESIRRSYDGHQKKMKQIEEKREKRVDHLKRLKEEKMGYEEHHIYIYNNM